jgi:adenosylcobinamide-phosphate synthase
MTFFLALPLAVLIDLMFGDPPNKLHPTAWMGSLIHRLLRFRPRGNAVAELLYGVFILVVGLALTAGAGWMLTLLAARLPFWAGLLLHTLVLKLTISLRGLDRAAAQVQAALQAGDLPEARRLLAWHLVSRDTSQLDAPKLAAAAIESVAENASDGILAPLFFYTLGGLPLALAYRFANTADSLLGYHDAEREWLGKIPARFDDLLNLIPARLTGLFILLAALVHGQDVWQGWRILRRDARLTASPNAGVPISAMAGALGVELEKVGQYVLGKGLRPSTPSDLLTARRLLIWTVTLAALACTYGSFLVHH